MSQQKLPFLWSQNLRTAVIVLTIVTAAWAAPKYKVVYRFPGREAGRGAGVLISDAHGNLYGATPDGGINKCGGAGGCGTVFELVRGSRGWERKNLYRFRGNPKDGGVPFMLVFDRKGNLYGTTGYGGGSGTCQLGCGTVFKLTPGAGGKWKETVLHSFAGGSDGTYPDSVIFDSAGNLYGTTSYGGGGSCFSYSGCGTVYELTPSGGRWRERLIYRFQGTTDSYGPAGMVINSGTIYGVTDTLGEGGGVAYKLERVSGQWKETTLYDFGGETPSGDLIMKSGKLYGGSSGGACGAVWELKRDSNQQWTKSVLHSFTGGADGCDPQGPLIFDRAGNFYADAYGVDADQNDLGNVFELVPGSDNKWSLQVLHHFAGGSQGAHPYGGVIFSGANLYGIAAFGGAPLRAGLRPDFRGGPVGASSFRNHFSGEESAARGVLCGQNSPTHSAWKGVDGVFRLRRGAGKPAPPLRSR